MPVMGVAMQGRASAAAASAAAGAGRGLPPDFAESDYSVGLRGMQAVCSSTTAAKVVPLESGVVKRPGVGYLGRPINVLTNHLRIAFKIDKVLVYEVSVSRVGGGRRRSGEGGEGGAGQEGEQPQQPRLPGALCAEVLAALAQQQAWPAAWAYDGRSCLYATRTVLPTDPTEIMVCLEGGRAPGAAAGGRRRCCGRCWWEVWQVIGERCLAYAAWPGSRRCICSLWAAPQLLAGEPAAGACSPPLSARAAAGPPRATSRAARRHHQHRALPLPRACALADAAGAAAQAPQESATFQVNSRVQAVLDVRSALLEFAGTAGGAA
jgi:hypothetical protein